MQIIKKLQSYKKILFVIAGLIFVVIFGLVINNNRKSVRNTNPKAIVSESSQKVTLNKDFEFKTSIINDQGQFVSKREGKIKFILTEAELKKEIKVKDETKQAGAGQNYLIIRIELQNDSSDRLAIISNKYIRLIGENNKKFSPDFHNAMVAIDPLSVRRDIVSYVVNENSKNFTFQIGELEGSKQTIEIAF